MAAPETMDISTIRMDNEAFSECPEGELARILRKIADQIEAGRTDGVIHDVNGNRVSDWEIN